MLINLEEIHLKESSEVFFQVFTNKPFDFKWLTEIKATFYLTDIFKDCNFKGFVFSIDEKIIGYCFGVLSLNLNVNQYIIKEIFIKNNEQNKGFGKIMLLEIEEFLKSINIKVVSLYTNSQIPAYSFYLKNNFQINANTIQMIKIL